MATSGCRERGRRPRRSAFSGRLAQGKSRTEVRVFGSGRASSDCAAVGGLYRQMPFLQQPFRDVDPIPVPPAPEAQLAGGGVHFFRESQSPGLRFELGRKNPSWNGPAPVGIPVLARRRWENDRDCHRPDDTPVGLLGLSMCTDYLGWCLANSSGVNLPALT